MFKKKADSAGAAAAKEEGRDAGYIACCRYAK